MTRLLPHIALPAFLASIVATSLLMAPGEAEAQTSAPQSSAQRSAALLETLRRTYAGTQFGNVTESAVNGLYEVVMGDRIAYTDNTGRFFFFGNLMDMQTQVNLTEERQSMMNRVTPSQLPLEQAIKTVKGSGARTLYVFADPECGFCKQLERTLDQVDNATIYTFLMPVLGARSAARAQAIWCATDRSTAWHAYMTRGVEPASQPCDSPIQSNVALGERLGVRGTPTIFNSAGRRVPGAVPLDRLQTLLNEAAPAVVSRAQP